MGLNSPKMRNNAKASLLNEKGMALGTALFACIILGAVTLYILDTNQNKKIVQEGITVAVSAENIKNKLVNALNSKPSWELTKNHNSAALAATPLTNPPKINIYDHETSSVIINSTNPSAGFDEAGNACTTFNAVEGNDRCMFRYEVTVKSVTNSGGQNVVIVRADLLFKPRTTKIAFNGKKGQFSFDHAIGADQKAAENICESIGGVFAQTSQTCTKQLTISAACNGATQTYQGQAPGSTGACGSTQLPQQTCPTGQYIYGYNPETRTVLCRNFEI